MDTPHEESKELAVAEPRAVTQSTLPMVITPVEDILQRIEVVRDLRQRVMKESVHFGQYPGWEKPALLQAGGDILRMTFNLSPQYVIERDEEVEQYVTESGIRHRGYIVKAILENMHTRQVWGVGEGSCSTLESKYRWRYAARECPTCGKDTIRKGAEKYGGGWYCNKKSDGCGSKFDETDPRITQQVVGRVENPDIADQFNTVLKIAKKRAYLDGVLNATAAREMFSSRIEVEEDEDDFPPPYQPPPLFKEKKPTPATAVSIISEIAAEAKKQKLSIEQIRTYIPTRFNKANETQLSNDELAILRMEVKEGAVKQFFALPEGRTGK